MNTKETALIVRRIDDGIDTIQARINVNTWLFGISSVVIVALVIMMIFVLLWLAQTKSVAQESKIIASQSNQIAVAAAEAAAANKARQEEQYRQYTDYIQRNIDVWNKLQRDNSSPSAVRRRGVNVPVAPSLRPSGLPAPSDRELERLVRPSPEVTPRIIRVPVQVKPKSKPTPTPRPWYDYFRSTK